MRRLVSCLAGALFIAALAAGPVAAAPPVRQVFHQVSDGVFGTCPDGSVINSHSEYDIIELVFADRIQFHVNTVIRLTHSLTGRYLTSSSAYNTVVYLDPNTEFGIARELDAGDFGHIVIPGTGVVYHVAGRIVINSNGDVVIQTGVNIGNGVDVCQALGPA